MSKKPQTIDPDSTTRSDAEDSGLFDVRYETMETLFHLAIWLWSLYLLFEAWGWDRRDRLVPLIAISLLTCLVILRFGQLWTPHLLPDRPSSDEFNIDIGTASNRSKREQHVHILYMLFWIVFVTVLIFFVGYFNALVVFIMGFVYFFSRDLRKAVLMTVVTYLVNYVLFIIILDIYPWEGYFELPQLLVRLF